MNGVYPCPQCKTRHPVGNLDDQTGLCPNCRGEKPPDRGANRACVVCGRAISGHSQRKTCSTRCRVALHRARKTLIARTEEHEPLTESGAQER